MNISPTYNIKYIYVYIYIYKPLKMKGPFPYQKNTQAAGKNETRSKVTGAHDIQKRHRDHRQRPSAWDESQNACIIQASGQVSKIGGSWGLISPTDLGFVFFCFFLDLLFFFCFLDFWDFLQKIQFQWIPKLHLKEMTSLGIFGVFLLDGLDGNKKIGLRKVAPCFFFWVEEFETTCLRKVAKK